MADVAAGALRRDRNGADGMSGTGLAAGRTADRTGDAPRRGGLAVTGCVATLAAVLATTVAAGLAQAAGVDFVVERGSAAVPLSGFAVVTGFFSAVGVVLAVAMRRWSARPAERFVQVAVALTLVSLVPPVLSPADAAATVALMGLHLVAATVMIPALARTLRTPTRGAGVGAGLSEP